MKMKTSHVLWIGIFLSGFRDSDGIDIPGYFGKGVTITCSHSWASTNIKYFCRAPCKDSTDILVKSDQSPAGRYRLKDSGDGTFTVIISDLQESDSGIYWCGVERFGYDSYTEVKLTVSKDPRESMTTSTEPHTYIQTSTDSHTITPEAHSESTSVTARKTTSYSSPDDITLSPSITASVNTTVYIYAVGGLLLAVIMLAVGLMTVHQYRKKNKTSESFTLPNQSKDNMNEGVYENDLLWTKSTQVKPINMTMTRQVKKSQEDAVYENSHELYGNL